jgi:hypothetical protein
MMPPLSPQLQRLYDEHVAGLLRYMRVMNALLRDDVVRLQPGVTVNVKVPERYLSKDEAMVVRLGHAIHVEWPHVFPGPVLPRSETIVITPEVVRYAMRQRRGAREEVVPVAKSGNKGKGGRKEMGKKGC